MENSADVGLLICKCYRMPISMMFPLHQNCKAPCRTLLCLNPTAHLACSPAGCQILLKLRHPSVFLHAGTLLSQPLSSGVFFGLQVPFQMSPVGEGGLAKGQFQPLQLHSGSGGGGVGGGGDSETATSESSSASSQCRWATPAPILLVKGEMWIRNKWKVGEGQIDSLPG